MVGSASTSHFGGVVVGVQRTIARPAAARVAIARSSQPQSNCPGAGSIRAQLNSPMRTWEMPMAAMARASSAQQLSGQCSG